MRTKQINRKSTGGKAPRALLRESSLGCFHKRKLITQEVLEIKRKERREKKVKLEYQHHLIDHSLFDITIKLENNDEKLPEIELMKYLKIKLNDHVCSPRCFLEIPEINYSSLNCESIFDDNVLFNVAFCNSICDAKCPELDQKFAAEIFEEFVQEQDEFESNMKELELFTENPESRYFYASENVDKIKSSIVEYRKCGKKCIYKRTDFDFEIVILLISEFEYFYFGHSQRHPFIGMPGLTYVNSGSTDGVSNLFPKKVNESFIPIPFNELLNSSKKFLDLFFQYGQF